MTPHRVVAEVVRLRTELSRVRLLSEDHFEVPNPTPCRLIVDCTAAGAWNMAVDEALLASVSDDGPCTLRFYCWSEPTLSLGYFQPYADREMHAASRACPVVRRSSGGGAILHDHELTYSLIVPVNHALTIAPENLYLFVHRALCQALTEVAGIVPELLPATSRTHRTERLPEPFLCFQRRGPGDVVLDESKICGSAQRRRKQGLLQHGSVLLRTSSAAPELPGIEDLAGRSIDHSSLISTWSGFLAGFLSLQCIESIVDNALERQAAEWLRLRYDFNGWTRKR